MKFDEAMKHLSDGKEMVLGQNAYRMQFYQPKFSPNKGDLRDIEVQWEGKGDWASRQSFANTEILSDQWQIREPVAT